MSDLFENPQTRIVMNVFNDDEPHALVVCGKCQRSYLYAGNVCPCPSCGSDEPTKPEPVENLMEILEDGRMVQFNSRRM